MYVGVDVGVEKRVQIPDRLLRMGFACVCDRDTHTHTHTHTQMEIQTERVSPLGCVHELRIC